MVSFVSYQEFIAEIIKKNKLENSITSIYAYGSMAQGNFEKNYSDPDLWFIINCNSVQERIELIRQFTKIFNRELKKFFHKIQGVFCHNNLYFTEEEFKKYYQLYPTRIIYPIKMNIWKLVYGKDLFSDVELPNRETCVQYLQYDFEMFCNEFHSLAFTVNTRDMIKYFLRALKKSIWILKDEYLSCKDEVLKKAPTIFGEDKLLNDLILRIQKLKERNYFIIGKEYLDFYLDCSKVLEHYGREIKSYVTSNNYKLIEKDKLYATTIWGNLAWEFTVTISCWWNYDTDKKNKKKLLAALLYEDQTFMKYFNYIAIHGLKVEDIYFGKYNAPLKRSLILEPIEIDKGVYQDL